MIKSVTREFGVLQKIYDGEIEICDKKPVNEKVDKLFGEVTDLLDTSDNKEIHELIDKFIEIVCLSEIEAFAKGVAFMKELNEDIEKVLI